MRELEAREIARAVAELYLAASRELPEDVVAAVRAAIEREESELGREILATILENARLAREQRLPICQDTGVAVVFVEWGQDVRLVGGSLEEAVNEGIRQAWREGYLRASVVDDPLLRRNTGDNTPGVVHVRLVPGAQVRLDVAPKGAGSENMSAVRMLTPADGIEGICRFVVETVDRAGANPCPPLIVGVGLGGTMERAAWLAKRALLRPVGQPSPQAHLAELEARLLCRINDLGIGPQGLGGRTTALAVHVEAAPCHIASLPVAVNLQCHAARHAGRVL
ncbi:MAG: fumarate hydratase [Desulfotomaculales bacterium]